MTNVQIVDVREDEAEILFEKRDDHIAIVTLNRPHKRNAISVAMTEALERFVEDSEADPNVWVVILTGAGERAFCAGADLAAVAKGESKGLSTASGGFAGFTGKPRTKPWIAAVRGSALAGGCELAIACEMIVAADDAKFGLPEVKRGMVAGAGGAARLACVLPPKIANEILATGDPIDARQARQFGLINYLVPSAEVLPTAVALARRICANSPVAVRESLDIARKAQFAPDEVARRLGEDAWARIRHSEDVREGVLAFVEKRAPRWTGR